MTALIIFLSSKKVMSGPIKMLQKALEALATALTLNTILSKGRNQYSFTSNDLVRNKNRQLLFVIYAYLAMDRN